MNEDAAGPILEKLDTIEARLLGIENVSGEGIDPQIAIHLLFRDFHNLKSSLSMAGSDILAKLVHEAESCLDALRSGRGKRNSSWVDDLLAVVDHVRSSVDLDEESPAEDLSERLQGLLASWLQDGSEPVREIGFPLDTAEATVLCASISGGSTIFTLEKILGENITQGELEALPVFDAIAEAGLLIAKRLTRVKDSGAVLTAVFASKKDRKELSFILFDPFYPVNVLLPPEKSRKDAAAQKKIMKILIVDDEAIALLLLQRFLTQYGRIDTAETGAEALEKIKQSIQRNDPYQAIFLDIVIPGSSGNAILEATRALEKTAGVMPPDGAKIIMQSTLSDYSSISSSFHNQCDAYLVKPIDSDAIDKTMQKFGFGKIKL